MKAWPEVALGELLWGTDESAVINPEAEYHDVTIKLWGKGVVSRGKVRGSDVVSVRRVVRANSPPRKTLPRSTRLRRVLLPAIER
jgi:type I restriction enzyme S subunit